MAATYRKIIRIYSVCLILMLILCAGIPLGAIAADTIKIGYLEAKSGVFESVGRFF